MDTGSTLTQDRPPPRRALPPVSEPKRTPPTRKLGRLVFVVVLLFCATIFASSSLPQHPEARPRPPATPIPEASPEYPVLAPPEPLSRTAEMRAATVAGRTTTYCSNGSVDRPATEVTRVIFVIHGNDRQACVVANAVLAAATPEQRATTLVVAPRFPIATDRINPQTDHFWTFASWSQGDQSANIENPMSSYAVLDDLVDRVRHLPFVVAGFSGGGQFVARYSAGTVHQPVRFIIASPSTYLYWNDKRPGIPSAQLGACPTYNNYRYGLNNLNEYMSAAGPTVLARRFGERHILYVLGDGDNDPRSNSMDRSCAAAAQGTNRLDRGLRYWDYLATVFGPDVHTRHTKVVVTKVGHNPFGMFAAEPAREALFN